jgi:AraC-like DNA-binding protein
VKLAPDIASFLAAPVGSYVVGRCWMAWCVSCRCAGFAMTGRPELPDIREAIALHDIVRSPGLSLPIDTVIDARRLQHIDPLVAAAYLDATVPRLDEFRRTVRRQALIAPGGLVGMIIAGFYPLMRNGPDAKLVEDLDAAFAWVDMPADAATTVRELVEGHTSLPEPLTRLHAWFAEHPSSRWSIEIAARTLGTTPRGLQRNLQDLGTSFRAERARARLDVAARMLARGDAKMAAIAAAVGFRSLPAFSAWFRGETGRMPSEYRRAQTAGDEVDAKRE